MQVKGRAALVTGGVSGIGRGFVGTLLDARARVSLNIASSLI